MKLIIQLMIWVLAASFSTDQPRIVEKSARISKGEKLTLDFRFADRINVKTWNKNEVYVKVSVNINENENNDAFRLDMEKTGEGLLVRSEIEKMEALAKQSVTITKSGDGDYEINGCNLKLYLTFEVFIPENIRLNIETISGDIVIKGFENEMDIETISGFIDLSLPAKKTFSIDMSTISGEMFSNADLEYPNGKAGLRRICGQEIEATLNGGGTAVKLETISGNIYLRKEK